MLCAYLAATAVLAPLARPILKARIRRGKEDPDRWREKLGRASAPRPEGRLVWLHGVGLGEVLALRGLIARLAAIDPDLNFLMTSTSLSSGQVIGQNMPARTRHQYLPLDLAGPTRAFLNHWRPDLAVWAEQDLWPGLVVRTDQRSIPMAMINARMGQRAFDARSRARRVYAALLARMAWLSAQDDRTARNLEHLGLTAPIRDRVAVTGPLKAAAPALAHDPDELARLKSTLGARPVWLATSSHPEDEAVALAAQRIAMDRGSTGLLIIAPRYPARGAAIAQMAAAAGLAANLRSRGELPIPDAPVWIADTFGEMGLWYRLCPVTLMGGTFGSVAGHNPWEPARLGSAIMHGPNTGNFRADYGMLKTACAVTEVADAPAVAAALSKDFAQQIAAAGRVLDQAAKGADEVAHRLMALIGADR